jgi:hypothetical protein
VNSSSDEKRQEAEVLHAEHHAGVFVPSLESCAEHTVADYLMLVDQIQARGFAAVSEMPEPADALRERERSDDKKIIEDALRLRDATAATYQVVPESVRVLDRLIGLLARKDRALDEIRAVVADLDDEASRNLDWALRRTSTLAHAIRGAAVAQQNAAQRLQRILSDLSEHQEGSGGSADE